VNEEPVAAAPEVFGPYALLACLGEGGMARVYRAVREGPMGFRKEVAIKRIRRDLTRDDQTLVKHLINEARLGGQLRHPNIVDVYEFGQVGDEHYIAMEFVNGLTLEALIYGVRRRGLTLPRSAVLDLGRQVADGLSYAHGASTGDGDPLNLVHRDLKPANVIVSAAGQAKIMDFGIARTAEALYKTTATDAAKGTLQYMAPEQLEEPDGIDHRADIFALGSILFETLVGEPLLQNSTAQSLMWMVVAGTFRPRLGMLDEVFPEIRPLVARCVEVDRDERFADAAELGKELQRLHEEVARGPGCKELMGMVGARADGDVDRLEQLGDDVLASERRSGGDTGWSDFVSGLKEIPTDSDDPFACGFHTPISAASIAGTVPEVEVSRKVTVAWRAEGGEEQEQEQERGQEPKKDGENGKEKGTGTGAGADEGGESVPPARPDRRIFVGVGLILVGLVVVLGWWRPWSSPIGVDPVSPDAAASGDAGASTTSWVEGESTRAGTEATPVHGATAPVEDGAEPSGEASTEAATGSVGAGEDITSGEPPPRERTADLPPPEAPPETADADAPTVAVRINSDPWSMVTMGGDQQAPPRQSPYSVDLPPGTYRFDLRVPDTGQTKTLTVTLDGSEGTLSRCHHFGKDGPC